MKKHLPYIVTMIVLIGIILLQQKCKQEDKPFIETVTTYSKLPADTIINNVICPVPTPVNIYYPVLNTVLDTVFIIRDYHAKVFYQDTVVNDTTLLICITDTIYKNRILSREFFMKDMRPTIVKTINTVSRVPKRNMIFPGISLGINQELKTSLNFDLILVTKKNRLYQVSNNIFDKQPNISIGTAWLLSFRKQDEINK